MRVRTSALVLLSALGVVAVTQRASESVAAPVRATLLWSPPSGLISTAAAPAPPRLHRIAVDRLGRGGYSDEES